MAYGNPFGQPTFIPDLDALAVKPNWWQRNPWMGTLLSGAFPLIGGLLANAGQAASARRQMEFQERMSSTAFRRGARDARAAGINPLSQFGGPASTPAGAQAQVGDVFSPAVGSALAHMRTRAEVIREMESARLTQQQQAIAAETLKTAAELVKQAGFNTRTSEARARLAEAELPWAESQAQIFKDLGEWGPIGKFLLLLMKQMRR